MIKSYRKHRIAHSLLSLIILTALDAWAEQPKAGDAPLTAEQVVKRMEEKNSERAAALHQFEGTRIYTMQYHGFPNDRDAEMVVTMSYRAPDTKEFKIVSQTGSKFVIDHVFKKLLTSEQEAMSEENRRRTALSAENYEFTLDSYETTPEVARYVLNAIPKTDNKFLYRGKIWVDATDFAVAKIEAAPAKNPSFWIKKTEIKHTYIKVDGFWFPSENHSQSSIRLGGTATLSILYKDYKVNNVSPIQNTEGKHPAANTALVGDR
jgi:hypothetical protein